MGTVTAKQISRHERSVTPPTLLAAFSYQVVFKQPVSDIFPGFYNAVEGGVEERLAEFESELNNSAVKGRGAALIARQLEWLWERNNPESA